MSGRFVAPGVPAALWGKAGEGNSFHPLLFHMLDVGNVAGVIFDEVLSERARAVLACGAELSGHQVGLLVALHDLGKASPAFQLKRADMLESWRSDFRWPRSEEEAAKDFSVNHGVVGAAELPRVLVGELGLRPDTAGRLALAVAGHHGSFAEFAATEAVGRGASRVRSGVGRREWDDLRSSLAATLACSFAAGDLTAWNPDDPACFILAGLTSVADWIGSNEEWFAYAPSADLDTYRQVSAERAARAVELLGMSRWSPRPQPFDERFPFPPRPAQAAADQVARSLNEPAIVVIEAEMGSGKTETAFNFSAEWTLAGQASGAYIALPTRATSNQMFTRAVEFIERSTGTPTAQVQLIHGLARLTSDFEAILEVPPPGPVRLSSVFDEGDPTIVRADDWFTSRKRSLLSMWGIGTVDAALVAALRVRHGFVRMFGLFDKVVIIDEVHAYDVYMSTLLDRLLRWLGRLRVPVVLLSATLPERRRSELLAAWAGRNVDVDVGYPGISWATPSTDGSRTVPASDVRSVGLDMRDGASEPSDIAAVLVDAVRNGGCVLGVCNTVRRAQEAFRAVEHTLARSEWGQDVEVHLLHARMLFGDRSARENQILDAFGPSGNRPERAIVVATQVVEQSLDLDFDLIVSDLAPVDLLLQRMGRLHRHDRERPDHFRSPSLVVAGWTRLDSGLVEFPAGSVTVYGEHLLVRTVAWIGDRTRVEVPGDLPKLVNAVYGDDPIPDERLTEQAASAVSAFEEQLAQERIEAKLRYVPDPGDTDLLSAATSRIGDEDNPDVHQRLQAVTRLSGPSVDIVALTATGQGTTCGPEGAPVDLDSLPHRDLTRSLLDRSVSVTQPGLVQRITALPPPAGWQRSAWLRHHRAIEFDRNGTATIGDWDLHLDTELGLVVARRTTGERAA